MSVVVRPATSDEIRLLRRDVLRPGGTLEPPPYDLRPSTRHVGAFDGQRVVGCATVFPEPYDGDASAWQLRGMAVDPTRQGEGIGGLVLAAAVDLVVAGGAALLWARGRVSALSFYGRHGWEPVGEVYTYGPAQLDHRTIVRQLSDPRRTVS
jgi:predicted N-acetyltransferase YhbS